MLILGVNGAFVFVGCRAARRIQDAGCSSHARSHQGRSRNTRSAEAASRQGMFHTMLHTSNYTV